MEQQWREKPRRSGTHANLSHTHEAPSPLAAHAGTHPKASRGCELLSNLYLCKRIYNPGKIFREKFGRVKISTYLCIKDLKEHLLEQEFEPHKNCLLWGFSVKQP